MGKSTRSQSNKSPSKAQDPQAAMAASAQNDSNYVSMSAVQELLKAQESAMRSLFESVVSDLTTKVDKALKSVEEIKISLQFTQRDVEELKPLRADFVKVKKQLDLLSKELDSHSLKLEYLENQSRRNNIRLNGIPESSKESWEDTEAKVKAAIKSKLNINVDIVRAHRVDARNSTKGRPNTNKPRTIVCKIRDWKQREEVLRKARKEKPVGLHISEDIALATLLKREPLIPKFKEAKEAGKIAYFILDKLIIRDRI